MDDGKPYLNTQACQDKLGNALRDARYLGLIDADAVIDQRNPEVKGWLTESRAVGDIQQSGTTTYFDSFDRPETSRPRYPKLGLERKDELVVAQRYHVEIWAEKSTQDDILYPLACRYAAMFFGGQGEVSLTRCTELIRRAKASGRPVRIIYISDFDPAGLSIPLTAARKFEFLIRQEGLDIDLQVNRIALTLEQCEEYDLPRTPIKPGEKRRDAFEETYGRGATELDALEALHPGSLQEIVEAELKRYFDESLDGKVQTAVRRYHNKLDEINEEIKYKWLDLGGPVLFRYDRGYDWLRVWHESVVADAEGIIAELNRRISKVNDEVDLIGNEIKQDLAAIPRPEMVLPEPAEGDEWPAPLMDSSRDYETQLNAYKAYQDRLQTDQRPPDVRASVMAQLGITPAAPIRKRAIR